MIFSPGALNHPTRGKGLAARAGSWFLAALLLAGTWAEAGSTPKVQAQSTHGQASSAAPEMTAGDVSAFLDGVMPLQLAREDIAGAVVLVVKDGKVLFAKGYGYADVEKRIPVTADGTLFRPGSISKLFTWTAVMQLVEQGKLDLDRDVNDYLDFKIPPAFSKPITLRNIMTHTSGFEETAKDMWVSNPSELRPLGDYLKEHLPQRIFPAGTTPAYSNYATTLAGYIVERVSGQRFDDYIEQNILAPLGMRDATFRQPLPKSIEPMMSRGYFLASQPPRAFELVEPAPAGSSALTAMAISRFMIAHLQDGRFEEARLLRPETAQVMHTRQFASLPGLSGWALGFYEESRNGHRIIGHAGDTLFFHSDLHLIPDAGVGFFVSYNSQGKAEISPRTAVWQKFLDRYFPFEAPAAAPLPSAAQDARAVSGSYLLTRRSETTILSIGMMLNQVKVIPNADHTISVGQMKDLNGVPKRFQEISPLLFREVGGQDLLAFKRDDSGRMILINDRPIAVGQRVAWHQASGFNLFILVGSLATCLLTLMLWPIAHFTRRHYGRALELSPVLWKLRTGSRLACALDLLFFVTFVAILSSAMKRFEMLSFRLDPWLHLLQLVGWLGALGALVGIWNAAASWRQPNRGLWSKLGDTALAAALVGFSWFALYWNMLHWNLNY
jgi:CubicO group peptidase (beta-lactamase class C family)